MMLMLIQIQRWLIKPKVWRFVCFVSSVVGLLCYALSSSFNHLFGRWTWWKILLYIFFSFFIGVAFLFPKPWDRSTSPRLKAHMAFLVLMITCVYSFFLDKMVKAKPDAYSLISSAAFAIMSLGLSRMSHCGFEVDLLYFFIGVLVVQLMKIKLWLVVVGAGFSYSLITFRSALDASGYSGLQVQDQVVIDISSNSQETIPNASHVNFPHAVTDSCNAHLMVTNPPQNEDLGFLITQVDSHSQGNSDSGLLMALGYIEALKKENGNVIRAISQHVEEFLKASVVNEDRILLHHDNNLVEDALPSGIINDLQETVRLMVTAGFKEECCRAYSNWRREFLEECVSTLGLQMEELNAEDVENIMEKIESWIKALNVAVTILFPNEWRLCDRVFEESISSADIAFTEVCKELAISLLNFANNLETWSWNQWPKSLSGIIPKVVNTLQEFELLFFGKSCLSLRNDARRVRKSLRICPVYHSEYLTHYDEEQAPVPGRIDPFTRGVMNYICDVLGNRDRGLRRKKLSLPVHMTKITELLERNLEANSKDYSNPTLGYVFIMNNRRFIQVEAKLCGMKTIFGEDWLQNNTTKLLQNLEFYQTSWNKILDFLKLDVDDSEPNVAAELMKHKLRSFNQHFHEVSKVQSTWFVFDEQLREQIIKSIENMLLPAYGSFIGRLQDFLGKHAYDHIKYGMFDVQDQVNNLFLVSK